MKTFSYDARSKFYFRYANLALSLVLLTYFVVLVISIGSRPYLAIPAMLILLIVYALNKYYINTYKNLPFVISADEEKLTASNYMFGKRVVEIKYSDIDEISGGVFGFNPKGLIYIHDGEHSLSISIHPNIDNVNILLRHVLGKVSKELRDESVKKLKQAEEGR